MKKIILLLASVSLMFGKADAQQDVMVSQYMFNGLFLNPAYSGTHDYFQSSILYRTQWVDMEGAPRTQLLAIDGPVSQDKMGLGFILAHDKIGVTEQTDLYGNYSYKLKMGEGKLSFGLKAGISMYRASLSELKYWDQNDQVFQSDIRGDVIPKFGFGTYYYTERFYAGLSIPTLLAYDNDYTFKVDLEKSGYLRRHYYLNTGYVLDLNENFKLKPSVLVKYQPSAPLQADFNMSTMYREMIWVGVSVRTGDAVSGMIEYQANQRFRIAYAYDYTFSNLRRYSNGTHEIMLGYDFGKEKVKMKNPRFF